MLYYKRQHTEEGPVVWQSWPNFSGRHAGIVHSRTERPTESWSNWYTDWISLSLFIQIWRRGSICLLCTATECLTMSSGHCPHMDSSVFGETHDTEGTQWYNILVTGWNVANIFTTTILQKFWHMKSHGKTNLYNGNRIMLQQREGWDDVTCQTEVSTWN